MKRDPDSTQALSALYQGEKTDVSSIFNTAMAMMGVAVAYLVGTAPLVGKTSDEHVGWLFLLLLPFPLWLVVVFHSLITLNAMSHVSSVRMIENALFEHSGLPFEKRDLIGSVAGDKIMDITQAHRAHQAATVVVYVGIFFLVVLFSVYSMKSSHDLLEKNAGLAGVPLRVPVIWIASFSYGLLLAITLASWKFGFDIVGENARRSRER